MSAYTAWAQGQPLLAAAASIVILAALALLLGTLRKTPAAVAVAALAAARGAHTRAADHRRSAVDRLRPDVQTHAEKCRAMPKPEAQR